MIKKKSFIRRHKNKQLGKHRHNKTFNADILGTKNKKSSFILSFSSILSNFKLDKRGKKGYTKNGIKFLWLMDYKEMRELLLQEKSLSKEDARRILELWQKNPRTYSDFLRNRSAFMLLDAYCRADMDEGRHLFGQTSVRVPSAAVAEKFFQLQDDTVNKMFKDIITTRAYDGNRDLDICAWPYLNRRCVSYYDGDFILELVCNMNYVFNFEADTDGELFEAMRKKLGVKGDWLAVNSFNITGWMKRQKEKANPADLRMYLMAQHATEQDDGEEASFRKLLLNYMADVEDGMNFYYQLMAETAGIAMS